MASRRKPQVGINLHRDVYDLMRMLEIRVPTTKTVLCTAGLLCLNGMKHRDRQRALQLAGLVNEGAISLKQYCEVQALEAAKFDAALEALIDAALHGVDEADEQVGKPAKRKGQRP